MTNSKASSKSAPDDPGARSRYVDQLRRMYEEGSLDEALTRDPMEVPDLLLHELFPYLFPMVH